MLLLLLLLLADMRNRRDDRSFDDRICAYMYH